MKPANSQPLLLAGAVFPTYPHPADALLIVDGKIRAVGRYRDLELPVNTVTEDLSGLTVLPGLGDAHVHFAATGFLQSAIDCRGIRTVAALVERVAVEARRKAPGELILGLRLEHLEFPSKRVPTLAELEGAAPNNPVYLRHITGHSSVTSRSALAYLDFQSGQPGVEVDENSEPTGYLIAQATQAATQTMYALNAQQVGYANAFRAAAQKAAEQGCTVVHALDDLGAVEELLKLEPDLSVRVLPYTQTFEVERVQALGLPRIGGCHGCALDGDFDMHTAALTTSYRGCPDDFGMLYHNDLSLQGFVLDAHRRGLQLAFHAVGDRAVEQALRAFERAQADYPRADPRHRIEHAQLMSAAQMARAQAAGVLLSVQPAFNHVWDHHTYDEWVGERSR
ncbi:MAG TPA: amidohydrolase family protein, partial [Chloroflexota bacterium]|nr:amidohydrolase family protein [Chloroflexota bacterium]